jgi:hypothetical protein
MYRKKFKKGRIYTDRPYWPTRERHEEENYSPKPRPKSKYQLSLPDIINLCMPSIVSNPEVIDSTEEIEIR